MPPSKATPLGPVWVRVVTCFLGMCFLPCALAAIWFEPNNLTAFVTLPPSVSVFLHSAHTLHTGNPPPMRPLFRYLLDALTHLRPRK